MNKEKKQRLEETIASIRHDYGEDVLRPLGDSDAGSTVPHLSTGFAALDRALGVGARDRSSDRDSVQGVSAARGIGPGVDPRSAGVDS